MIGSILERIVSKDKVCPATAPLSIDWGWRSELKHGTAGRLAMQDHRYMAVSDLQSELQKPEFRVDEGTERRLCKVVLQQLEDASGDVSGLAVKW